MEQFFAWSMVAATIALTSYGQLMLKWEVQRNVTPTFIWMTDWPVLLQLLVRPGVVSALGAAFGASLCWMMALKKLPLNLAYPFMSMNFVLVTVIAVPLFGEELSVSKISGLGLIVLGLVFISKG